MSSSLHFLRIEWRVLVKSDTYLRGKEKGQGCGHKLLRPTDSWAIVWTRANDRESAFRGSFPRRDSS